MRMNLVDLCSACRTSSGQVLCHTAVVVVNVTTTWRPSVSVRLDTTPISAPRVQFQPESLADEHRCRSLPLPLSQTTVMLRDQRIRRYRNPAPELPDSVPRGHSRRPVGCDDCDWRRRPRADCVDCSTSLRCHVIIHRRTTRRCCRASDCPAVAAAAAASARSTTDREGVLQPATAQSQRVPPPVSAGAGPPLPTRSVHGDTRPLQSDQPGPARSDPGHVGKRSG